MYWTLSGSVFEGITALSESGMCPHFKMRTFTCVPYSILKRGLGLPCCLLSIYPPWVFNFSARLLLFFPDLMSSWQLQIMKNTNNFRLALATEHAINLLLACTDQNFQKYLSTRRWLFTWFWEASVVFFVVWESIVQWKESTTKDPILVSKQDFMFGLGHSGKVI